MTMRQHAVSDDFLRPDSINAFTDALRGAKYNVDAVLERLGEAGQEGLTRNQTMPALDRLGDATDAQADLIRLFPLQQIVPRSRLAAFLDVPALIEAGVLSAIGREGIHADIDVRPYGFTDAAGEWSGWVAADPIPGMDSMVTRTRPNYVLGVSPASTSLAQLTVPDRVGSALDLGAGCGVQSLHLARHADTVTLTDINPRALDMARLTLALNGLDLDVRAGSFYEPVAHDSFDLIVTNPPYVMSPPTDAADRLVYREGGFAGDGLVRHVVREGASHLADGGLLQVLANWADTREASWEDRLAEWVRGTGCDLWVVEREHLDVYSYIEMWLTDAGLSGDPIWLDRYAEWLNYFDAQGITGVGLGWIMVRKSGSAEPSVHMESWPYTIAQPVGAALSAGWTARDVAGLDDDELLARTFTVDPSVVQEATGRPGAADPSHVVLRQTAGLCRALAVDAAVGGVIGACDGELPLGVLIGAVAGLLDQPVDELEAAILPRLREAIEQGFIA